MATKTRRLRLLLRRVVLRFLIDGTERRLQALHAYQRALAEDMADVSSAVESFRFKRNRLIVDLSRVTLELRRP